MATATQKDFLDKFFANAKQSSGGEYFTDGGYIWDLVNLQLKTGVKGTSFIAEMKIIKSWSTVNDENGKPIPPCPEGSVRSFVVNLTTSKYPESSAGEVTDYLLRLLGAPADQDKISPEDREALLGPEAYAEQPLKGKRGSCLVWHKPSSKRSKFKWAHVEQTEEEIAEGRKALGG